MDTISILLFINVIFSVFKDYVTKKNGNKILKFNLMTYSGKTVIKFIQGENRVLIKNNSSTLELDSSQPLTNLVAALFQILPDQKYLISFFKSKKGEKNRAAKIIFFESGSISLHDEITLTNTYFDDLV